MYDVCETRLRGQMERGQGHNTNEVEAEASCSQAEAEARFFLASRPRPQRGLNIPDLSAVFTAACIIPDVPLMELLTRFSLTAL